MPSRKTEKTTGSTGARGKKSRVVQNGSGARASGAAESNAEGKADASQPGPDPAPEKLREARERLQAVLDEVGERADELETKFQKHLSEAELSLKDEIDRAERKIRENPLLSVGIAAAAGLVIGLLLNRNQ